MSLYECRVSIRPEAVPEVEVLLGEIETEQWVVVEEPLVSAAWLTGFFCDQETAADGWKELAPRVKAFLSGDDPLFAGVEDRDWKESYKDHFSAWRSGSVHWVPVWERERYALPSGDVVIWLDPGLAFGTGNHETTRLCLERLTDWASEMKSAHVDPADCKVIDAGSGSGILSLSAAALGMNPVRGFDLDPEAVRVSRENARLNELTERVRFDEANLEGGFGGEQGDLIFANILADVLVRERECLLAAVAPGGRLVLSGILASELTGVKEAFEGIGSGFHYSSRIMGDWADLLGVRA